VLFRSHVCYKSLLFLSAGSILVRTGETSLARVGGLWSLMPVTAACALVGSLSISGMPPFNGFASKWLIYEVTILGAPALPVFVVLGIVAAFISLVTLASFLKFIGGAFLGPPRARLEEIGRGDVPASMQIPQLALAGLCVIFGLVPMLPLAGIYRALTPLASFGAATTLSSLVGTSWYGVQLSFVPGVTTGVWVPVVGLSALLILTLLAHGFSRLGAAERRQVETWNCGTLALGEQGRYPAHSLYDAFKRAFSGVYPRVRMPRAGYPVRLMSAFDLDRWLFQPALRAGGKLTELVSHTHSGIPQLYLSWQVAGLVVVVVTLFVWMR
jgi:hydrogenase-4 component B